MKFTEEHTKRLISLRKNADYLKKFAKHKGNSYELNKLWYEIANELGTEFSSSDVKSKFNNLLKVYIEKKKQASKSGEGRVKWKFFEYFNSSILEESVKLISDSCKESTKESLKMIF
ncbi:hypothetical protein HERIO_358 [Hepatospora eriocheir]|uniref:Myb/SANT-like DNA-binding domain-containing protein n=1 Tax=Hepatospora eriocheir TaxID=1081669 RepID=A0A1X0QDD7_9MICR|nr:hypothetical protein HERIO_358 [Hepatospora eriocheir]